MNTRILIIEDNPDIRENTAEMLAFAGYEVLKAENGMEGIRLAKSELPDLIICDIMMPGLDGFGVLHMLTKHPETAAIPLIFLTAKAEPSDIRKGMNLGADDYLTKPFEETDLLHAVESRIKRSERYKQHYGKGIDALSKLVEETSGKNAVEVLMESTEVRHFKKREVILHEGDPARHLLMVKSGRVKLSKDTEEGKELIVELLEPNDFFGYTALINGTPYTETAMAMEESEVAYIAMSEFEKYMETHHEVAIRFLKILSGNVMEKEERLLKLAYGTVRERVAEALRTFSDKHGSALIRVSRDDLARMAGTATETLIRTLTDFKEEGILRVEGRSITILKPERLSNIYEIHPGTEK